MISRIDISPIYQAILESMGEGIIFADADGTLAFINRTAEQIRGISAANFIGRSILSIHSPNSVERIRKLLDGLKDGSIGQSRAVPAKNWLPPQSTTKANAERS